MRRTLIALVVSALAACGSPPADAGGQVESADGSLRLVLPAGSPEVVVSGIDPASVPDADLLPSIVAAYDLSPDGTSFDEPVDVEVDTAGVGMAALFLRGSDGTWTAPTNQVLAGRTMTATLGHFSTLVLVGGAFELSPSESPVGELVPVPGSVVVVLGTAEAVVTDAVAIEGSEPGLSFGGGGFTCAAAGTWPIGVDVAISLSDVVGAPTAVVSMEADWSCVEAAPTTSLPPISFPSTTAPEEVDAAELDSPGVPFELPSATWRLYEWLGMLVAIIPEESEPPFDCQFTGNGVTVFKEGPCVTRMATQQTIGDEDALWLFNLYWDVGTIDPGAPPMPGAPPLHGFVRDDERTPDELPNTVVILALDATAQIQVIEIYSDDAAPWVSGVLQVPPGQLPSLPTARWIVDPWADDDVPHVYERDGTVVDQDSRSPTRDDVIDAFGSYFEPQG